MKIDLTKNQGVEESNNVFLNTPAPDQSPASKMEDMGAPIDLALEEEADLVEPGVAETPADSKAEMT